MRLPHPAAGLLAVVFAAVAGITCSESSTGPSKGQLGQLALAPTFSKEAEDVYRNLASFQLEVNNIRVRLLRDNGEVAIDTVVVIVPGQDSVVLELNVPLSSGREETFDAAIELRDGDIVLFVGSQRVVARSGPGRSPPTAAIELEYDGPGATVTTLDILPDTTIVAPDNLTMRAVAFDQNNQPVTQLNLRWSVSDATRATISENGVLTPLGPRGTVVVTAALPTGVSATASINIQSRPTLLVVTGGANQTAAVNTNLPLAVEFEVRAADNLPVANYPVTITSTGGSVLQSSANTDVNGRVSASVRMGTLAGAFTVTATAAGITAATTNATATAGPAARFAIVQQPSASASSGIPFPTQPSIQVQDEFGNSAPAANIAVTAQLTTASGRTLAGTTTRNTDANGVATFTDLRISGPVGSTTLTFTQAPLTAVTSSAIVLGPGAAASVSAPDGTASADTAGALSTVPAVIVRDASSNVVPGVEVKFRRHGGAGSAINAQPDTMVLVTTDANGRAALSSRRLQTLIGTDTVLATATGLTDTLKFVATVTHASASRVVFVQQPSSATAGANIAPAVTVHVLDQFGNHVTSGPGSVSTVAITLPAGTLTGTATANAVAGVATFSALAVQTAGSGFQLIAGGTGLTAAFSEAFNVNVGPVASISAIPTTTLTDTAGTAVAAGLLPAVVVRDAANNAVPNVAVKFRRHSGVNGTINAQPDTVVIVNTNATGTAALTARRLQTVPGFDTVLVTADGLTDTLRFAATVTHASAHNLAFVLQPQSGTAGSTMPDFTVEVRDQFGNRVTSGAGSTSTVALSMSGATISGTTTVSALAGLATFTGLSITPAGSPYQITAASAPLASATSASFSMGSNDVPTTRTWLTATSGLWETASNWSGGSVPGPQDTVVINHASALSVSINSAVSIAKLTIGGGSASNVVGLTGVGASLTVSDSIKIATNGGLLVGLSTATAVTSGPIVVDGVLQWFSGTIGGTGSIRVNTDAAVLIGNSAATTLVGRTLDNGGTLIFSGTDPIALALSNGASIENSGEFLFQGSADITQGPGAAGSFLNVGTVRKVVGDANTTTIGVAFSNAATATLEIQTGTLAFTGPSLTNTVDATIRGTGLLDVSGVTTFSNAGILSPGFSPGSLAINGNLPMQGTTRLLIDIGGTEPGTEHDVIEVLGNAALSGTLEVSVLHSPTVGESFTIMEFASRSGSFANMTGLSLGGGLRLEPQFTATELRLVVVSDVPTATINWVTGASGNWNTASNWDLGRVPNGSDIVGLGGSTNYVVTLDVNATIAGLVISGDNSIALMGTGRQLTLNGNAFIGVTGWLSLTNSTLDGTGVVTGTGEVSLINSTSASTITLNNEGFLYLEGTTVVNGPINTADNSQVIVAGNTLAGTGNVTVANGFTVNGTLFITGTSGFASTLTVTNGSLVIGSTGELRSNNTGGSRTLAAQLDNQGLLRTNVPLTIAKPGADHVNSGTIDASANLEIEQSGTTPSFTNTNTGTIVIGANREIEINGGIVDIDEGFINGGSNAGIRMTGATAHLAAGVFTDVWLTLNSTTIAGGALTVNESEVLRLSQSTIAEPVNLVVSGNSFGTLFVRGNTTLNGALAIGPNGVIEIEAGSEAGTLLTVANGFTNHGRIHLNGISGNAADLLVTGNGILTNANGGVIRSLNSGNRTITATVVNQQGGTIDVDAALILNAVNADHVNHGAIDIGLANFHVTQSGASPTFTQTATGTVVLAGSRAWTVDGGVLDLSAGTITADGTSRIITSGAVLLTVSAATVSNVPLQLSAGTQIPGAALTVPSGQTLNLMGNGSTSTFNGNLTVQGTLLLNGTTSIDGSVNVATGGTMILRGQTTGGGSIATIDAGVTTAGEIVLTATGTQASTLNVTNSTLTIASGGILRVQGPLNRTVAAQLSVQQGGSVIVDANTQLNVNRANSDHVNDGVINATNGDVTFTMSGSSPSFTNGANGSIVLGATNGRTVTFTVSGGTSDAEVSLLAGTVTSGLDQWLVTSGSAALTLALAMPVVNAVPLRLGANTTLANPLTVASGENLTLSAQPGTSTLNGDLTIQNGGVLLLKGNTQLNGALTLQTGATMRVHGDSWAGAAVATVATGFTNSGTIELTSNVSAAATLNVTSGALTNASGANINSLPGSGGARTLAAQLINQSGGTLNVDAPLTIDKASAAHTNAGTIDLADANLGITQSGTTPSFTNNSIVTIGATRSFVITGGAFSNGSTGTIRGTGTLDVASTTPTQSGTIAPNGTGATGTFNVTGPYSQDASGTLAIELGGTSQYDALAVSSAATVGGTLDVTLINGFVPTLGNSFTILTADSRSGTFSQLNLPALTAGLEWMVQSNANSVVLLVVEDGPFSVYWLSAVSGNWSDGTRWSTGVPPTSTDVVGITTSGTYTVTLDVNTTVAGLTLGTGNTGSAQTLAATSRTLTVNGAVSVALGGQLQLVSSTMDGTGGVTNLASLDLINSHITKPLDNQGLLTAYGTSAQLSNTISNTGTLRVRGETSTGNATLTVAQGFVNSGLVELRSPSGTFNSTLVVTTGTLVNASGGRIHSLESGARTLTAQIDNQNGGTIEVDAALTIDKGEADHVNAGSLDLSGASLTVSQSGTSPSFTTANTSNVNMGAGVEFIVNSGTLDIAQGVIIGSALARVQMNGGALVMAPSSLGVPITFNTPTVNSGSVAVADGEILRLRGGTVHPDVAVQSGGTLVVTDNTAMPGALSILAGGTLSVSGQSYGAATLTVANGFTNSGTIELTSAANAASTLNVTTGSLTNANGAFIGSLPGSGGARTLGAQLDNQQGGTVDIDAALTIDKPGADHNNEGTIDAQDASFSLILNGPTPTFTNIFTGVVNLGPASSTWTTTVQGDVTGAVLNINNGAVTGSNDTRVITNGSSPLSLLITPATGQAPLQLASNTTTNGLTIESGQTLTLIGNGTTSTYTGNIAIDLGGTLLTHGTVALNGALSIAPTGVLRVRGQATGGAATVTAANGFTNNGLIELASTGGLGSAFNVTTGTLTNASGGIVRTSNTGARTIGAQILNQSGGLLDFDASVTIDKANAAHVNEGSVEMTVPGNTVTWALSGTAPSFTNASTGTITFPTGSSTGELYFASGSGATGVTVDIDEGTIQGGVATRLITTGTTALSLAFSPNAVLMPMQLAPSTTIAGTTTIDESQVLHLMGNGTTSTFNGDIVMQPGSQILANGFVHLNGALTKNGGKLTAYGQAIGGPATLTVTNGFTNNGDIELRGNGGHAVTLNVTNGTIVNANGGSIQSLDAGPRTLAAQIQNNQGGTILVADGGLTIDKDGAAHVNNGFINLTTNSGSGLTIQLDGTSPSFTNGSTGSISFPSSEFGVDLTFAAGVGATGAAVTIDDGTVTGGMLSRIITSGFSPIELAIENVSVPLQLGAATTMASGLTVGTGQTVTLIGRDGATSYLNGSLFQSENSTLQVLGNVQFTAGVNTLQQSTIRVKGQSNGGNATLTVDNGFTNTGTIELTGDDAFTSTIGVTNGSLTNSVGTISALAGGGGQRTLGAQLLNTGTVSIGSGATFSLFRASANHVHEGILDLAGGLFIVNQTGTSPSFQQTSTGVVNMAGGEWRVSGGHLDIDEGTVSGAQGVIWMNTASTLAFTPANVTVDLKLAADVVVNGGAQITIANGQMLTLNGAGGTSTIDENIVVQNGGTLLTTGTTFLNGSLDVQSGGMLRNYGRSTTSDAILTILNGFTNSGTIELDSESAAELSWILVTNGTLTNAPGSQIHSTGDGGRTLTAQLTNSGAISVGNTLLINKASATHTNNNLIELNSDNSASLTIEQSGTSPSFTNNGDIQLNRSDNTLTVIGGTFTHIEGDARELTGPGTINVSATTFVNNGVIRPNGLLNVAGNYTQNSGGTLRIFMTNSECSTYDRLAVTGTASVAGALSVQRQECVPGVGNYVPLTSGGALTGTFSPLNLPDLTAFSRTWSSQYQANAFVLTVSNQ